MKSLQIGDLTVKYPIIQGGMGIGISLSNLASAVTNCGGLGVISSAQIGFKDINFAKKPVEANLKALKEHIKIAKEKTSNGILGVNIMVVNNEYEEYVKCASEAGADIIISGAGLPVSLPKILKGTKTKFAPIVSSVKATKLLMSMWDRRFNTTCDMVVVENHLAGGHLGFKSEQIQEYISEKNFDEEFKNIVEFVKKYEEKFNKSIPVIYAGGVFDKLDIQHCLELGAAGVQMGTRFVTTHECDASIEYKNTYINAKEEDIRIVKSPVGLPGRAINNDFIKRDYREQIQKCYKCLPKCDINTTPYCISERLINSAKGKVNDGLLFCGAKAYKCKEIISVKEVFEQLI